MMGMTALEEAKLKIANAGHPAYRGPFVPEFHIYELETAYGKTLYSARTRNQAISEAYTDFSEAFEGVSYIEFKDNVVLRCRRVEAPEPPDDGYDYIRRQYGVDVRIGDRVGFKGEPGLEGEEGEVLYPGRSSAHVKVLISNRTSWVHPISVVKIDATS